VIKEKYRNGIGNRKSIIRN